MSPLDPPARAPGPPPTLDAYRPVPMVRVPVTAPRPPAAPVIDAHNHLGRWLASWVGRDGDWVVEDVAALLALMDEQRIAAIVNLDGRWGDELEANLDRYDRAHPGRFAPSATSTGRSCARTRPRSGARCAGRRRPGRRG